MRFVVGMRFAVGKWFALDMCLRVGWPEPVQDVSSALVLARKKISVASLLRVAGL
jgi:hypothetical protein